MSAAEQLAQKLMAWSVVPVFEGTNSSMVHDDLRAAAAELRRLEQLNAKLTRDFDDVSRSNTEMSDSVVNREMEVCKLREELADTKERLEISEHFKGISERVAYDHLGEVRRMRKQVEEMTAKLGERALELAALRRQIQTITP